MLKAMKIPTQKNIKTTSLVVFLFKVVCIDDKFSKLIVVFRGENAAYEFIKAILNEYKYWKKVVKKHFNKNVLKKKKIYFNKVTFVGFVQNSLIMMTKK